MKIKNLALGFLFVISSLYIMIYLTEDLVISLGINPVILKLKPIFALVLFFAGLYFFLSMGES